MIDDLSLEEVLERGLEEAKQLFEEEKPLLADYTLSLVKQRYQSEGTTVHPEVEQLRQDIREKIKHTYPTKIENKIASGNLREAMGHFLHLSLCYGKEMPKTNPASPHIPGEFYHLITLIEDRRKSQGCR